MLKSNRQLTRRRPSRGGFTLVEMMVSVALVLMIMVMFATVYSMATETISLQRAIGRNDEHAVKLSTVIRSDLENRTFLDVIAFAPGQDTGLGTPGSYVPGRRGGYFAISENDPDKNDDDVLFLTVRIPADGSQAPFVGRAVTLVTRQGAIDAGLDPITDPPEPPQIPPNEPEKTKWFIQYLAGNPNQPENDDGAVTPNQTAASRAIEVAYFLRNGNLYRRQVLIRDPYDDEGSGDQPPELTGLYGGISGGNVTGIFWEDFDQSAFYRPPATPPNMPADDGPRFHGLKSLDNLSTDAINPVTKFPDSLGVPHLRFGYSIDSGPLPREYIGTAPNRIPIMRFTSQETADKNFLYPGRIPAAGRHPFTRKDLTITDGVINELNGNTTRRGVDLLMTNVHEFDVKVWDDVLGEFVDLGHEKSKGGVNGHYHRNNNRDNAVKTGTNWDWNRYDTWHPYRDENLPFGSQDLGRAPYQPRNGGTTNPIQLGSNEEVPLRAIQITIRFFDPSSDRMRQVTILQTLVK